LFCNIFEKQIVLSLLSYTEMLHKWCIFV